VSTSDKTVQVVLASFAFLSTALLVLEVLGIKPWASSPLVWGPVYLHLTYYVTIPRFLQSNSPIITPLSWAAFLGAWVWSSRKTRTQWARLGIDKDLFRLLKQMRGSYTRTLLLKSLSVPKDRSQLARDLSLDWSTIDYQMEVLLKHKLISEKSNYGQVKVYEISALGMTLLRVLDDMQKANSESQAEASNRFR
jgi:DNA-binding transcriptional ArsR family regulator